MVGGGGILKYVSYECRRIGAAVLIRLIMFRVNGTSAKCVNVPAFRIRDKCQWCAVGFIR